MMYLLRVAIVTLRALNGVSQLVLMCASTPEAVRNCRSAMSSRSATALESCGCTSTISESVNQRIRSMSCTARSITTPTFDMRGGNGPTRVMAIDRMSSPRIASLIASTVGLKRSTWPTISVTPAWRAAAMILRPSATDGGDRLFDQDMHATLDAVEREFLMQVRRRRDGDGIDALRRAARSTSANAAHPSALATISRCLAIGIRDADEVHARQDRRITRAWLPPMTPTPTTPTRSNAALRAAFGGLHDGQKYPLPALSIAALPSTLAGELGDASEIREPANTVLIQIVTESNECRLWQLDQRL